jgi:hypothetical protein
MTQYKYKPGTNILHSDHGPAVVCTDGYKYWYQNGKCHRVDGPAIESTDGYKAWYIKGKQLTEKQFNGFIKLLKAGKIRPVSHSHNLKV